MVPETEEIEQGAEELERAFSPSSDLCFTVAYDAYPSVRWLKPYRELEVSMRVWCGCWRGGGGVGGCGRAGGGGACVRVGGGWGEARLPGRSSLTAPLSLTRLPPLPPLPPLQVTLEAASTPELDAAEVESKLRALRKNGAPLRVEAARGVEVRRARRLLGCCGSH